MGFPRQEYWSGWSFPPPGDLPDPGIEPASPLSPALQEDFFFLPAERSGKLDKTITEQKNVSFKLGEHNCIDERR